MAERIPLAAADPGDLARRVAAALGRSALVALPTETVYGVAVRPGDDRATALLRALKGRPEQNPFTWHLADRAELARLCDEPQPRVARLLDRYWPGPLTVVLPARDPAALPPAGVRDGNVGLRLPAQPFTRAVTAACGGALWLSSVNRSGEPPLCDAEEIERQFGPGLELIVDAGRSPLGNASTVVLATGPRLQVLREGILSAAEVLGAAARTVLFICTGNTCRSPLAEALARREAARALAVAAPDLLAMGLQFVSAGTSTLGGMPASEGSQFVAREAGLDLAGHRSRALDAALLQRADRIYGLSGSHLARLQELAPALGPRLALLDPQGRDIADPFGGDATDYRAARDQIAAAVRARVVEWIELLGN